MYDIILAKTYDFLISNIMTYSYKLGYLSFKRLMISFQNSGIVFIFERSCQIIKKFFQTNKFSIELIDVYLRLMLNCLSFNFNLCFYEYETDLAMSDTNIIIVNINLRKFKIIIKLCIILKYLIVNILISENLKIILNNAYT